MLSVLADTPLWQLSVERYHAMLDRGILGPDDAVELLEGVLVQKMPKHSPHRIATLKSRRALESVIPAGWYVDEQEPITLGDSEPEPDVAVIWGDTAGIPWYWVVDLNNRRVEVYSQPDGSDYLRHTTHGPHDSIAVVLDGQVVGEIPVTDLLP